MAHVYTHSVFDAFVCEAKGLDAMKPRYSKVGPPRQGQIGHRLAQGYLGHLHRTGQETDFQAGAAMWKQLTSQASPDDIAAVDDSCTAFILDNAFPWVVSAKELNLEVERFFTIPDRVEIPADRVHLVNGPVFRITCDMSWHGEGPVQVEKPGWWVLDWKWHRVIEHVKSPVINTQLRRYTAALHGPDDGDVYAALGFPRKSYYEYDVFTPEARQLAWEELVVAPAQRLERLLERAPHEPEKTVGPHCRHCDLLLTCDAASRYPYEAPWLEGASPQEKATSLAILKAIHKTLTDQVKSYVNDNGTITDDDMVTEIGDTEVMSFDKDIVIKVLGGLGIPEDMIHQAFKATKTSLEKVMKAAKVKPDARREVIDELRVTADRELRTRLKLSKVKHERDKSSDVDGEGSA